MTDWNKRITGIAHDVRLEGGDVESLWRTRLEVHVGSCDIYDEGPVVLLTLKSPTTPGLLVELALHPKDAQELAARLREGAPLKRKLQQKPAQPVEPTPSPVVQDSFDQLLDELIAEGERTYMLDEKDKPK